MRSLRAGDFPFLPPASASRSATREFQRDARCARISRGPFSPEVDRRTCSCRWLRAVQPFPTRPIAARLLAECGSGLLGCIDTRCEVKLRVLSKAEVAFAIGNWPQE